VKDWTAELQPAHLGQRPTLGQSDSETPATSLCCCLCCCSQPVS